MKQKVKAYDLFRFATVCNDFVCNILNIDLHCLALLIISMLCKVLAEYFVKDIEVFLG